MVYLHKGEILIHSDHHPVGTLCKGILSYSNQSGTQPRTAQDVIRAKSLDILETIGQKYVNAFHIGKLINFASVNIGILWQKRNSILSGSRA